MSSQTAQDLAERRSERREPSRFSTTSSPVVELVRLLVVLLLTAVGYSLGPTAASLFEADPVTARLVTSVLGALIGYVLGGVTGRGFVTGVDRAEERLRRIEAAVLIAAILGATFAGALGLLILGPVLVLPARSVTVPVAVAIVAVLVYMGARLGAARGGDLLRFVGARGRIQVTSPSRGEGVKLVDTSVLIDGRIIEVVRGGFLEGTLVVPRFVIDEMQGLADSEDGRRRNAGRRGLDTLQMLQDEQMIAVEVTDDDDRRFQEVDAKLASLARERNAALMTVDSNLARAAEVGGVRVLNLHALAEAVRPPVIPGERISLRIVKEGTEEAQGVGYLPDGTMIVVERAADHVGDKIVAEVTSLLQTRNGRMAFANAVGTDQP
ncbi:MAG: PIN/TRAM domain-containing protein [Actinobacteria bacterium]|nr:PIN/TRAM domain-containing protein [Actinomycetota bacterium]